MDIRNAGPVLLDFAIQAGLRILGAIALWIVGRILIGFVGSLVSRGLARQRIDPTLGRYISSTVTVVLNVLLVIAILNVFGVETTTFAALLAAAGVAIGVAWSGLLGNFAAGIFLVVLRPFKVGDFVTVGGVTGTVEEVGLFVTSLNAADNVRTYVGNSKIFSDTIQNFSTNPYRRVDLMAQLPHSVDPAGPIRLLKERVARIPDVLSQPAPDVEVLQFNLAGPVLAVRPYCSNAHYWQVYFDANRVIRECFGEAGYPVPEQHYRMHAAAAHQA
jgi:small conductance mechanosensitive channel